MTTHRAEFKGRKPNRCGTVYPTSLCHSRHFMVGDRITTDPNEVDCQHCIELGAPEEPGPGSNDPPGEYTVEIKRDLEGDPFGIVYKDGVEVWRDKPWRVRDGSAQANAYAKRDDLQRGSERLHKGDGMANEVNILTKENRLQAAELKRQTGCDDTALKELYETDGLKNVVNVRLGEEKQKRLHLLDRLGSMLNALREEAASPMADLGCARTGINVAVRAVKKALEEP